MSSKILSPVEGPGSTEKHSEAPGPPPGLESPFNFSTARKLSIIAPTLWFAFNGSLGSSLPSGSQDELARYFGISPDDVRLVLPASLYILGFGVGPCLFGPSSEYFGRKPTLIFTYATYLIFTMACALASTFTALLVFRFFCGLGGSVTTIIMGALYSDLYDNPEQRGMVMSVYIFANTIPALLSPIMTGYVSQMSWRWTYWAGLIIGAVGFPFVLTIPETYMPVLIRRHEKAQNKGQGASSASQRLKMGVREFSAKMVPVLTRPYVMIVQEPIVLCCAVYISLLYSLLYLFFQAYPVVFENLYGMSPSVAGLAFLPMVGGTFLAFIVFLLWSSYHKRALHAGSTWARAEEYRRLPLACIGAPLIPISLFWFGWSSKLSISPVVPMMSGILFGTGYVLSFIALLNYLTDAYQQFSASATAATASTRSIFAVCLPLATTPMYTSIGINWASSMLGFFAIATAVIPFVFIRYGEWIRLHSKFAQRAARGDLLYQRDIL